MSMKDDTLLARWLAGELEGEELEALKSDPSYPNLVRIADNFERIKAPDFDKEAMLQKITAMEKRSPKVIPLYKSAWFQAAAAIVILLGSGLFFFKPNEYSASNGETYALTLPDNSEVILNDGSTISYSKRNWDERREVKLEGESYFKVAKGKTFSVVTPQGSVTVLGTQFNVKAREGRFEVSCYEGKVSVMHLNREFVLMPSQGITFTGDSDTGVQEVKVHQPQWLHEEMAFTEASLNEIVAEMERQYDVEIDTKAQSKQAFTGTLPANNLDAALKIVSTTYHLKFTKNNNTITLEPADARP